MYGADPTMYLYHYVNYGIYEGRPNGTVTDPAKVIAWNPAVAEMGNAKMSPQAIMNNYTVTTGQITTTILSNPPKQATPTVTYYYSSRSHEHDWYYESIDDVKHWKKCHDCDDEHKEDHHYKVKSQTNGTDTSKHVLKCSRCDHKFVQAHYDRNGDGRCDECGYQMVAPHVHQYPATWTWVDGTTTHTHTCTVAGCTVSETANCNNTSGGTCTGCNHVYPAPAHVHNFGTITWNSGTTTHTKTCTAAGCTTPPYSFTEDCDHTDGGTCSGCGHVYESTQPDPPAHTHEFSGDYTSNGNGTHSRNCTAANCPGGEGSTQTEDCNHDGDGGNCTCGYVWPQSQP